jgi:DNA-binding SARP family transcriptional activator
MSDIDGLIRRRRGSAELHFLGIGLLNRAYLCIAAAQPQSALDSADEAIAMLTLTSQAVDLISARTVRAYALAYLGRIDEARTEIRKAAEDAAPGQYLEIALEAAQIEGHFGESTLAWPYLERAAAEITPETDLGDQAIYGRALLHIREGRFEKALRDTSQLAFGRLGTSISLDAQRYFAKGLAQLLLGSKDAVGSIARGIGLARLQSATLWENYGGLLRAMADASSSPSAEIVRAESSHPATLSMLADAVVLRLDDVEAEAFGAIAREAGRRPWRWRAPARRIVQSKGRPGRERAADLLEVVGDASDVALLRQVSRASRSGAGQRRGIGLARRLAAKVFVEDLGRVRVYVGPRLLDGSGIRRKVLALLCLLLSKPRFSSTREEVIDSLWPEHDPQSALNSLNQTAYFLRRVFEPDYQEASSPGYVGQDVETIWLEPELVDCRSRRCLEIIRTMPAEPTPEGSVALATEYEGRYALDFAYEDWSGPYRDYLHASYLRVMEQAVRLDLDAGHLLRGTFLAERAFAVDPDAEEIQVALISLYRLSGAHAAAAETYARYERAMREIGEEPIPLADL